jgi:hypothetical protein
MKDYGSTAPERRFRRLVQKQVVPLRIACAILPDPGTAT